jgi:hypothetical protein
MLVGEPECVNTDYGRYSRVWGQKYPPSEEEGSTEEQINRDAGLLEVRSDKILKMTETRFRIHRFV